MKKLKLTNGEVAWVDNRDYDRVVKLTWGKVKRGKTYYAANWPTPENGKKRIVYLHQFILQCPGVEIDHKDRNGLNCTRRNLRRATHQQNSMNRPAPDTNTSGFKGVSWHSLRNAWRARIEVLGKEHHLGLFESARDAAKAYNRAAKQFFGKVAFLNAVS